MLTFLDMEADNVVGIRIDGKITTEEFEVTETRLKDKMKNHPKVRIYTEIIAFKGITLKGLLEDLKFGLSNWDKLDREAIVTDKKWMQEGAKIGDKLSGSFEVKAFSFEEKEAAKAWVQS